MMNGKKKPIMGMAKGYKDGGMVKIKGKNC